jgi:hypothetical protein
MKYYIGELYRYPNRGQKFKLIVVTENGICHFECGHWCTDNVFTDLIRVKTGVQVYKDIQTQLFT